MNIKIATVVLITTIASCKPITTHNSIALEENKISLDIDAFPTEVSILNNDLADIEIIPLEINSESAIIRASKVLRTENGIFVMDWYGQKLLKFDLNGNFIKKIGRKGAGPGEYAYLDNICIDEKTQEIAIFSQLDKKILFYDQDGKFIREIKLPYANTNSGLIGGDFIVTAASRSFPILDSLGARYQLIIYDGDGKVQSKHFPIEINLESDVVIGLSQGPFPGTLIYGKGFDPTYYLIDNKGRITKYLQFDLGSYQVDTTKLFKEDRQIVDRLKNLSNDQDHAFLHGRLFSNKSLLGIEVKRAEKNYFVLINQKDHSSFPYLGSSPKYIGSFFGIDVPTPTSLYNQKFIGASNATDFCKSVALLNDDQLLGLDKKNISLKIIKRATPEDNPLIFIYRFRETL